MANELDVMIAGLTAHRRVVDLNHIGYEGPIGEIVSYLAVKIDALVAAEQGAGTLASLTTVMGDLTTTMRSSIAAVIAASAPIRVTG